MLAIRTNSPASVEASFSDSSASASSLPSPQQEQEKQDQHEQKHDEKQQPEPEEEKRQKEQEQEEEEEQAVARQEAKRRRLRSNTATEKGRLLALCMVYAADSPEKDFGQVWRDRLRLQALEDDGYEVYSCDMGHPQEMAKDNRHLQANFDHAQRFRKAFLERWGADFDIATVCFDYFYIPSEWANTRWGTGAFMNEVVPWLMDECRVRELWLPNHPVVRALLEEARKESWPANLGDRLRVEYVADPMRNPLYRATAAVDHRFVESTKEAKTNANQCKDYTDAKRPFIRIW